MEGIQASESPFKFVQPQSKVEVGGSVHPTKLEDTMQKVLGLLQSNQKSGYMYKNYPKTSEWPTFDGKRDSDWVTFLIKIDAFKLSYKIPDEEVTSKLISILTGVAGVWYQAVLPSHPNCSWEEWKQMITKKFGGSTWRNKQLQLFESEKWIRTEEPLVYLLRVAKSLSALYPKITAEDAKAKMILKIPIELKDLVTARSSGVTDISEFVNISEEVMSNSRCFIEEDESLEEFEKSSTDFTLSEEQEFVDEGTAPLCDSTSRTTLPSRNTCRKCGDAWNQ